MTPDEQTLLRGCREGDDEAWLALFQTYATDVGTFLRGMLHTTDVDDLVQKVFLSFLSSLDRFRGDASLRTWLLRIARNVALREIRDRTRRRRHLRAYARSVDEPQAAPDGQVHARDQLARIQRLVAGLDDRFREVWVLRELGFCSVAETAAILDIPESTVRTRHHRARARLFDSLAEDDSVPDLTVVKP